MREYQSSAVRANLEALRAVPEFPELAARFPPDLQAFVARPPSAGWVPASELERVSDAVLEACGPDALRRAGRAAVNGGFARLVMPAMRTIMALFGVGPDAIYSRVPTFVGGFERGTTYVFERTGEHSGLFTVRGESPLGEGGLFMLEGAFVGMLDLAKRTGEVRPHERIGDGREARVEVRWT